MRAANRAGGFMTMPERRFPNRLYVDKPGRSYFWLVDAVSRLGSRRSLQVLLPETFHDGSWQAAQSRHALRAVPYQARHLCSPRPRKTNSVRIDICLL